MRVFAALIALLACLPASAANYALLIGIDQYDRSVITRGVVPLTYADDDAVALGKLLEQKGYQVKVLDNRNARAEYIHAEFTALYASVKPQDSFLLYFAGHGVRDPDSQATYWLTYDTNLENLDDKGIRLSHLLDYVKSVKATQKIVLLDHCFSGDIIEQVAAAGAMPAALQPGGTPAPAADGAAPAAGGARAGATGVAKEKVIATDGRRAVFPTAQIVPEIERSASGLLVLAAARYEAFESDKLKHGVFTEALIRALATRRANSGTPADHDLSAFELIEFVTKEVKVISTDLGLTQETLDIANARNIAEWIVAPLPPLGAEAGEQKDLYLQRIGSWRARGPSAENWISLGAMMICQSALEAWVESRQNNTQLDPQLIAIVASIKAHVELVGQNGFEEKRIAESLEREVTPLWNTRNQP